MLMKQIAEIVSRSLMVGNRKQHSAILSSFNASIYSGFYDRYQTVDTPKLFPLKFGTSTKTIWIIAKAVSFL